jgi:hypothetical protein
MINKKVSLYSTESGYIALLSTIIIGAVLLVITIEVGQSGWYTRFMVLGTEAKMQSRELAQSCGRLAVARVLVDTEWIGNTTTTNALGTCYVFPLQKNNPSAGLMTVQVQSVVQGSVTRLISEYDMKEASLSSTPLSVPSTAPSTFPDLELQLVTWKEII